MIKYADRVIETSATQGTGTINLGGAVTGYQSFVSGVGNGAKVPYCIEDGLNWEVGVGTVTAGSPDTLSRDVIVRSSNGTSAIDWGSGVRNVFLGSSSMFMMWRDENLNDVNGIGVTSGTANAHIVTLTPAPLALSDNMLIQWRAPADNTGNVTINVNGLGVKQYINNDLTQFPAGRIKAGSIQEARYNSAQDRFERTTMAYGTIASADMVATNETSWNGLLGDNVQKVFDNIDPLFARVTSDVTGPIVEDFEEWPFMKGGWSEANGVITRSDEQASQGEYSLKCQSTSNKNLGSPSNIVEIGKKYAIDVFVPSTGTPHTNISISALGISSHAIPVNDSWFTLTGVAVGSILSVNFTGGSGLRDVYIDNLREIVEVTETHSKAQIVVDGDYRGYDVLTSGDVHAKMLEGKPFIIQGVVAGFTNAPMSYGTSIVGLIQPKTISANLTVYEYTPLGFSDMGLNQWIRRDNSVDNWTIWLPQNDLPSNRVTNITAPASGSTVEALHDGRMIAYTSGNTDFVQLYNASKGYGGSALGGSGTGFEPVVCVEVNKGDLVRVRYTSGASVTIRNSKSNRTI